MSSDSVMATPERVHLYRRFVCRFEEEISKQQRQHLIYIRLYPLREKYRDASTLDVLAKLEADGVFGPNHVEGLLEIARDIGHKRLEKETKDFIRDFAKSRSKGKVAECTISSLQEGEVTNSEIISHEELHLRSTLEVALSLLTILMLQIDAFQEKLNAGEQERKRMFKTMREASQTAKKLASSLIPDTEQEASGDASSCETTSSPRTRERLSYYENTAQGLQAQQKPSMQFSSHPSNSRGIQSPQQQRQQVSSNQQRNRRKLENSASLPPTPPPRQQSSETSRAGAQSLERTGVKGQKERLSLASSKPRRYAKPGEESGDSVVAVQRQPTVPQHKPRSKDTRGITLTESVLLQPSESTAEDNTAGDSGFAEVGKWRQYNQLPNPPQDDADYEPLDQPHYYKSLRDGDIEHHDYTSTYLWSP